MKARKSYYIRVFSWLENNSFSEILHVSNMYRMLLLSPLPVTDAGSGKVEPVDFQVGPLRVVSENQQADSGELLTANCRHQVVEEVCVTSKVAAGVGPVTHLNSHTLLEGFLLVVGVQDELVFLEKKRAA